MSADPLARAQQVFLAGNQLPARWAGRPRFVVLETGFGLGHNFLATWAAWRQDSQRCTQLHYLAISHQPPQRSALRQAHALSPLQGLATTLADQWPPLTPDLHLITLDGGRVRLLLAVGDIGQLLPDLVASADALYIDSFVNARENRNPPGAPPSWDTYPLRLLKRLAAPGATVATWATHSAVLDGLRSAGFTLQQAAGAASAAGAAGTAGGAAGITAGISAGITVGQFAPRFSAPPPPGRRPLAGLAAGGNQVAVVGAGLAGAAVARALAAQGISVLVVDRQPGCAHETSGNTGGLFHGVVHGHDGHHARWLRAAALHTQQVLRPLLGGSVQTTPVAGALRGLLRGEQTLAAAQMRALVQRLGLPADYVQVLAHALPGEQPAWLYPGGGWVAPADLCRAWLAAPNISLRYNSAVDQLQPCATGWRLLGPGGRPITDVQAVVLCNASDATRLLGWPGQPTPPHWPLQRQRGQTTLLPASTPGLPALPLPLADGGYALRLADGGVLCGGSTAARRDTTEHTDSTLLRDTDHLQHLASLRRLTGWAGTVDLATLGGRVGWRLQTDDRLPLLGPLPTADALATGAAIDAATDAATDALTTDGSPAGAAGAAARHLRLDQPRFAPRITGLYVFTALGSRGITQAALGGEVLACWLTGAPMPLASSLLDALDPARFGARAARLTRPHPR